MSQYLFGICLLLCLTTLSVTGLFDRIHGLPADHVIYPVLNKKIGKTEGLKEAERLPRGFVHSIYKFGKCSPPMLQKVCLRKKSNITFTDWLSAATNYVYLLEQNSQRYRFQCVVMKVMVARQFVFGRGRLPIYYCQGTLRYVYLMTFQKIDIHEFYFILQFKFPVTLLFEFYHGRFIDRHADFPEQA